MGEKIQVKAISGQLLTCEYNGQIFKTSVTNTDYIQQIESAKKQATENERLAT